MPDNVRENAVRQNQKKNGGLIAPRRVDGPAAPIPEADQGGSGKAKRWPTVTLNASRAVHSGWHDAHMGLVPISVSVVRYPRARRACSETAAGTYLRSVMCIPAALPFRGMLYGIKGSCSA